MTRRSRRRASPCLATLRAFLIALLILARRTPPSVGALYRLSGR